MDQKASAPLPVTHCMKSGNPARIVGSFCNGVDEADVGYFDQYLYMVYTVGIGSSKITPNKVGNCFHLCLHHDTV